MAANNRLLSNSAFIAIIVIAMVLLIFPNFSLAQAPLNNSQSLFYQANGYYEKGDFERAIALYQQILANGYDSGNLYYNLGNSYFKLGKRGMAILYYEKAKRLIPGDADLKANLSYAVNAGDGNQDWKLALHDAVTGFAPLGNLFVISSFIFFITAIILILGIMFPAIIRDDKNNQLKPWWPWLLIVCGCFLVLVVSVTTLTCIDQNTTQAIVTKNNGTAHFEPNSEATIYYSLNEGAKVQILDKTGDWYLVKRQDGKRGWVENSYLETI